MPTFADRATLIRLSDGKKFEVPRFPTTLPCRAEAPDMVSVLVYPGSRPVWLGSDDVEVYVEASDPRVSFVARAADARERLAGT
jgi:hypothetical protein